MNDVKIKAFKWIGVTYQIFKINLFCVSLSIPIIRISNLAWCIENIVSRYSLIVHKIFRIMTYSIRYEHTTLPYKEHTLLKLPDMH